MTSKEYLSQARYLDVRINSKVEQIESLKALATKCTSTLTGMPHNPSSSTSIMADVVCKIVELQDEINKDISKLVRIKREIVRAIKSVKNVEYQTILEKRYLCYTPWEQIAIDMNYGIDNIFKLHKKALGVVVIPESVQ